MHADGMALAADSTMMLEPHLVRLQQRRRDRVFWLCLLLAFAVHALAILAMVTWRQNHRTLGSPDGAADAIAVEIVDGATLKDSMEPPTPAVPPPGQPPTQTAAVQPTPPEAQPVPPEPEPPAEQPQAEALPEPPLPEPQAEAPPQAAPEAAQALEAMEQAPTAEQQATPAEPPVQTEPPPVEKQEAPKKQAAKQPAKQEQKAAAQKRQKHSALDLSVPFDGSASSDGGSSSAVQRPPGITRSGENDEFARNVIRALQRSMPRERALGRVTVRIVLNDSGSRADVTLLKSGGDPDLDFNVMFAARQTAYPFPPKGATLADRTFMVTYIYR